MHGAKEGRPRFGRSDRSVTFVTPPRLSSFPNERDQIEYSSRSIVFRREGEGILRVWGRPERPWVLGVEPEGKRWRVQAWGGSPADARRAVRELFSLDHPIEAFYGLARVEPVLSGTIRQFRGLRIPRDPSLYEALIHSIISQQLSVRVATVLKERLFAVTDAVVEVENVEVPHVPGPASVIALGAEGMRRLGLSQVKGRSLVALAERQVRGGLDQPDWGSAPLDTVVGRLDELPGVGRWTAENALLRGVGRPDVFVAGDLAIRLALEGYRVVPKGSPEERLRRWCNRCYPGWGSYVTLYLWRRWVSERMMEPAG
ncbi:MAG: hypothetical protein WCA77_08195 [Thermoplasmata archaeon]